MDDDAPFYVICAGTRHAAARWAALHGIGDDEFTFAGRPCDVVGYPEFISVRLPCFYSRGDWPLVDEAVRDNDLRMAARAVAGT